MKTQTLTFCLLITLFLGCQKKSILSGDGGGEDTQVTADQWQGARLMVKSGDSATLTPVVRNKTMEVSSMDLLTFEKEGEDYQSFLKTISKFQMETTCIEQNGQALSSEVYQSTLTLKKFSEIEILSLLPRQNQIEAQSKLKCNFTLFIQNAIGSVIGWSAFEMIISTDSTKNTLVIQDSEQQVLKPQTLITVSDLERARLSLEEVQKQTVELACTHYKKSFSMDELKRKNILIEQGEDLRRQYPIQDCVFVYQNLEEGRVLVTPPYLVDFEVRPQIDVRFERHSPTMDVSTRMQPHPYFTIQITNKESFPVLVGYSNDPTEYRVQAEFLFVTDGNSSIGYGNKKYLFTDNTEWAFQIHNSTISKFDTRGSDHAISLPAGQTMTISTTTKPVRTPCTGYDLKETELHSQHVAKLAGIALQRSAPAPFFLLSPIYSNTGGTYIRAKTLGESQSKILMQSQVIALDKTALNQYEGTIKSAHIMRCF
ncbi:MAG: hypothetical protein AB7F59_02230 [Bdellovibrionales bacterium]